MARAPTAALALHRPGPRSLEDTLRDGVRSSPYLTASLLVHLALLLIFAAAPVRPVLEQHPLIRSQPAPEPVLLPPPTTEPEPPAVERILEPAFEPVPVEADTFAGPVDTEPGDPLAPPGPPDSPRSPGGILGVGPGSGAEGTGTSRGGKLRGRGSPTRFDPAIDAALRWLARHQEADGRWSAAGFDAQCTTDGPACDGLGQPQHDVGVTGLALLAFLGAGHGRRLPGDPFADTVRRALSFLVRDAQAADGNFGPPQSGQHTYDHALATLAVVEAWALTDDLVLEQPAARALAHLADSRTPGNGWRYAAFHPDMALHPADTSVTGWALLALCLGRDYGLPVDARAIEDGLGFLDEMTDPATGVTGYIQRGGRPAREAGAGAAWPPDESESMTAVALLCRIFADPDLQRPGAREAVERAAAVVCALPPVWDDALPGRRDYYFWYYATTALFQVGGERWEAWSDTLQQAVAAQQRSDGHAAGSWDPQHDPWGGIGGRVYATALQALTLESYQRYATVLGQQRRPRR